MFCLFTKDTVAVPTPEEEVMFLFLFGFHPRLTELLIMCILHTLQSTRDISGVEYATHCCMLLNIVLYLGL